MARRSKEEVLSEFHHLFDCLEAFMVAEDPFIGKSNASLRREMMVSRKKMVAAIDGGAMSASQALSGAKSAVSDLRRNLKLYRTDEPETAEKIEEAYVSARGTFFETDIERSRLKKAVVNND